MLRADRHRSVRPGDQPGRVAADLVAVDRVGLEQLVARVVNGQRPEGVDRRGTLEMQRAGLRAGEQPPVESV